jgi:hypothetical protein
MTMATASSAALIQPAMADVPKLGLPIRGLINALNVVLLQQGVLADVGMFQLQRRQSA